MSPADFDLAHAATVAQVESLMATLPPGCRVHHYEGPRGKGFDVVLRAEDGGQAWQRTISHGPDAARRTAPWARVDTVALVDRTEK